MILSLAVLIEQMLVICGQLYRHGSQHIPY